MCFYHSFGSLILNTNFTNVKKVCGKLVLIPETKYYINKYGEEDSCGNAATSTRRRVWRHIFIIRVSEGRVYDILGVCGARDNMAELVPASRSDG